MPPPADFDQLYSASRRRLVHQTFALTGDLGTAGGAVRDAFVAARQHWRKVGRLEDPESWVRARAWTLAQRRRVGRVWHRERDLGAGERQVLAALQRLTDPQRKTLLLNHLAALTLGQIGREIGETRERVEEHLQHATSALAVALDIDSTAIRRRLEQLAPPARRASLPRVTTVHREGVRRQRVHAVLGALVAVAVALSAGAVVTGAPDLSSATPLIGTLAPASPSTSAPAPPATSAPAHPVSGSMLLTADELGRAAPGNDWVIWSTSDNSGGTGLNTACQGSRFADRAGLATFVRTFDATGRPHRQGVQTVEVSQSSAAASRAYRTALGWYADCTRTHSQLVSSYRVSGLGDAARVLQLRLTGDRWYGVGLARTGAVTTRTVLETTHGHPARAAALSDDLATAVGKLCHADLAGRCVSPSPRVVRSLPPHSGEQPGMLASVDLPFVDHVRRPWVGTRAAPSGTNMAATPCDHTDFTALGAERAMTRTFLVPQARLPQRFGITETYGAFAGPTPASRALRTVEQRMAKCSRADLGAHVGHARVVAHSRSGSSYALWRVEVEISAHRRVGFWMGVARIGRYLAQVTFSPAPGKDIGAPAFRSLVERARDRLLELP